jgi:hypothetical protein
VDGTVINAAWVWFDSLPVEGVDGFDSLLKNSRNNSANKSVIQSIRTKYYIYVAKRVNMLSHSLQGLTKKVCK